MMHAANRNQNKIGTLEKNKKIKKGLNRKPIKNVKVLFVLLLVDFMLNYLFFTGTLFAQEYIAVLDVEGTVSEAIKIQLADETRAGTLAALPKSRFTVLTRENMLSVLQDQNKDATCFEGSCEVEIGRNIGADFIISGQVVQIEGTYLYSVKIHNTETGALVGTQRIEGDSGLSLVRNTAQQTQELISNTLVEEVTVPESPKESLSIVHFSSTPRDAQVWLDDEQICPTTPCTMGVTKGFHVVEFRKDRHQRWKAEFQTKNGLEIRADLISSSTTLHLSSQSAGIDVFLDDNYIGKTPLAPKEIEPGQHVLRYDGSCSSPIEEQFLAKEGVDIFREINIPDYQTPIHVKAINQHGKVLRARVYIDGDFVGYTPFHESISTCSNRIEVEAEIYGMVQRRSLPLSLRENATEYMTLEFYQKRVRKKKQKKRRRKREIQR